MGMTTDEMQQAEVIIREYPNAHGRGLAVTNRGRVIGAQLPIWQMRLVCILAGGPWVIDWAS